MRKLSTLVSAACLALAVSTTAHGLPFTGSVSFTFLPLGTIVASGSGSGTSIVSPNSVTLPTAFAATGPLLFGPPGPPFTPVTAVLIDLSAPVGTFAGTPLGGAAPLGGRMTMLAAGGNPLVIVPLSGLGVTGPVGFGPYASYIAANPWSVGTTGYDNRTLGGGGTIKLVTSGVWWSSLAAAFSPLSASMTLTFVPEPGTMVLVGAGVAALAIIGRRRTRERS